MKNGFEKSLKLPKMFLGWAGIQIFSSNDQSVVHLLKSQIFYFNFLVLGSALFGELYWLIEGIYTGQSLDKLYTTAPCVTVCVLAITKFNCLYFNKCLVEHVAEKLRTIHPTDEEELNENERRIIDNSLKFLNTVMMCFCSSSVAVVIVFGSASVLSMVYDYVNTGSAEFKLPFRIEYFFEITTLTQWAFIYLHQIGSMLVAFVDLLSADLLLYAFCAYLQMHFQLLCLAFENVVSKSKVDTRNNFKNAVKKHQQLIELVEQIELLYSKSTLCNIILSSLLICLSGFVVTFIHDVEAVSSFVAFLVMNLTQISLLCYFGDMLNSASTQVSQAVYNSLWYEAEPFIKKSVLIVIIRAQKPCKLTAMKFADLNLNALSAILRTSWSYFALLKTMYD